MNSDESAARLSSLCTEARTIALEAGRRIQAGAEEGHHRDVTHKGRVDLVTRVDHEVQSYVLEALRGLCPGESLVAEEGDVGADGSPPSAGPRWVVDPIDGTTNFVYRHPFYCVSIAREDPGGRSLGVVYAPALDELFVAETGAGAWLEQPERGGAPRRLRASDCDALDRALVATGFPYHRGATARVNVALLGRALASCRGVRRGGSAALDLCYVAAGRLDGFWEFGLKPWDVAAGRVIAIEATARVTDFRGRDDLEDARRVCAAAPGLHAALLAMIVAGHEDPTLDALGPPPATPVPLEGPLPTDLASDPKD